MQGDRVRQISEAETVDDFISKIDGAVDTSGMTYTWSERAGDVMIGWAASLVEENMRPHCEIASRVDPDWSWDSSLTRSQLAHPSTRFVFLWRPLEGEEGSAPVAFVSFRFEADEVDPEDGWCVYVWDIQVSRASQGRGLGSRLLGAVYAIARSAGASMVRLTCFTENRSALRFYHREGFALDPISPVPGRETTAHVIMRKKL